MYVVPMLHAALYALELKPWTSAITPHMRDKFCRPGKLKALRMSEARTPRYIGILARGRYFITACVTT